MWRWSVCTKRQEGQQEGSRSTDAGVPTSLARLVSISAKFERTISRVTLSLPRGETKSPCWRFATVETKSNNECSCNRRVCQPSPPPWKCQPACMVWPARPSGPRSCDRRFVPWASPVSNAPSAYRHYSDTVCRNEKMPEPKRCKGRCNLSVPTTH